MAELTSTNGSSHIGFVVSFIVAYGAVAWFMAWVRKRGFAPFALYRIVIGIAVLVGAGVIEGSRHKAQPSPKRTSTLTSFARWNLQRGVEGNGVQDNSVCSLRCLGKEIVSALFRGGE